MKNVAKQPRPGNLERRARAELERWALDIGDDAKSIPPADIYGTSLSPELAQLKKRESDRERAKHKKGSRDRRNFQAEQPLVPTFDEIYQLGAKQRLSEDIEHSLNQGCYSSTLRDEPRVGWAEDLERAIRRLCVGTQGLPTKERDRLRGLYLSLDPSLLVLSFGLRHRSGPLTKEELAISEEFRKITAEYARRPKGLQVSPTAADDLQLSLPAPDRANAGRVASLHRLTADGAVTVSAPGALINGETSYVVADELGRTDLTFDGTNYLASQHTATMDLGIDVDGTVITSGTVNSNNSNSLTFRSPQIDLMQQAVDLAVQHGVLDRKNRTFLVAPSYITTRVVRAIAHRLAPTKQGHGTFARDGFIALLRSPVELARLMRSPGRRQIGAERDIIDWLNANQVEVSPV
jgi:hypothetical protein